MRLREPFYDRRQFTLDMENKTTHKTHPNEFKRNEIKRNKILKTKFNAIVFTHCCAALKWRNPFPFYYRWRYSRICIELWLTIKPWTHRCSSPKVNRVRCAHSTQKFNQIDSEEWERCISHRAHTCRIMHNDIMEWQLTATHARAQSSPHHAAIDN